MASAVAATTSRSGGLGALAGCLAVFVFMLRGRPAVVGGALAFAVVAVALAVIVFSPLRLLNDDPGPTRLHLWPDAIQMIAARPVTGWGEDATGLVFGQFLSGNWAPEVDRAHSGPLDIAATQGVLGLGMLAWVLITVFRGGWRWRFTESIGALTAVGIGYSVWVLFNFDWVPATAAFWLLAGTAWSAVRAAETGSALPAAVPTEPGPRRRAAGAVAAVILAVSVAGLALMPVLADIWYYQSRPDLSVIVDPLQGRYHWALGQGLVAIGSTSRGLNQMQLAARLGENDPQLYVDLGDAEQRLGRSADARASYRMALKIDPYFRPAIQRLAGKGVPG